MRDYVKISQNVEFEWDEANKKKNEIKHKVNYIECEQVFLNNPVFLKDENHSKIEMRYVCIGITELRRVLFISYTMRNLKVRVISARTADKKERKIYEEAKKTSNF